MPSRGEDMVHPSRTYLRWQPQSSWLEAGDDDEVPSSEPTPGDPARTAIAGAVAGVVGAWLALAIAQGVHDPARLVEYLRVAVGGTSTLDVTPGSVWMAVVLVGFAGWLPGAGLAWLMRRLHGVVGRLVFGAIFVPSLWIAFDAFGLLRLLPRHAELVPFVPWLLGAVAYGVCVALVRPVTPPSPPIEESPIQPLDDVWTFDPPSSASSGASFLLLRRKA
jgi:hypothetical protein